MRSLVGLDRDAALRAFADIYASVSLTADQLAFVDLMVEHVVAQGILEPRDLYGTPFVDFGNAGIDDVFARADVVRLFAVLREVNGRAD